MTQNTSFSSKKLPICYFSFSNFNYLSASFSSVIFNKKHMTLAFPLGAGPTNVFFTIPFITTR